MSNLNELKPVGNLSPFTRFCCTIGNLPSSYMVSLTYEEQLLWLCDYLQNTVIPAVNTNAEAVKELQELYVKLKDYVDNYFNNLDVQQEINNKLDEMAESGELSEIITHYLQIAGLLCFNTTNDLKNATNLINGSFVKTYGNTIFNDGEGNFYKIRTLLNTDNVDNINIIALNNFPTLIAELIKNNDITILKNDVNIINDNLLNPLKYKKFIFIGDSYGVGRSDNEIIKSWIDYCVQYLNISQNNYYKIAEQGSGFVRKGINEHTFLTLLQSFENTISNKQEITDIILCAGVNDYSVQDSELSTAMTNFINYCKQNFPNAVIKFGMISNKNGLTPDDKNERNLINNYILRFYQLACTKGAFYLNGVEKIMKYYYFFSSDNLHPNASGYQYLGAGIAQAILTGNVNWSFVNLENTKLTNENISSNNLEFIRKIFGDNLYFGCQGGSITFNTSINENSDYHTVDIGNLLNDNYFRTVEGSCPSIYTICKFTLENGNIWSCPCVLNISNNGRVYLRTYLFNFITGGMSQLTLTNIKKIDFSPFSHTLPLMLT